MQPHPPFHHDCGRELSRLVGEYQRLHQALERLEKQGLADRRVVRLAMSKNAELAQMLAAYQARHFNGCR
jgi:hypothetical protein